MSVRMYHHKNEGNGIKTWTHAQVHRCARPSNDSDCNIIASEHLLHLKDSEIDGATMDTLGTEKEKSARAEQKSHWGSESRSLTGRTQNRKRQRRHRKKCLEQHAPAADSMSSLQKLSCHKQTRKLVAIFCSILNVHDYRRKQDNETNRAKDITALSDKKGILATDQSSKRIEQISAWRIPHPSFMQITSQRRRLYHLWCHTQVDTGHHRHTCACFLCPSLALQQKTHRDQQSRSTRVFR